MCVFERDETLIQGRHRCDREQRTDVARGGGEIIICSLSADGIALRCVAYTGLFISPSGISELDCATTKTDTAERSISIGRESLQVFFLY